MLVDGMKSSILIFLLIGTFKVNTFSLRFYAMNTEEVGDYLFYFFDTGAIIDSILIIYYSY